MNILVTGTAGFIGFHIVKTLLNKDENFNITGIDNINNYYDVNLKYARLNECGINKNNIRNNKLIDSQLFSKYKFSQTDLTDLPALEKLFKEQQFDVVINMAAQAGVRYSIENPHSYVQSNIVGFTNILECCKNYQIKHLIYASSSSVYGQNNKIPFLEDDEVNNPVSFYAATKRSNELMAYTYSHLFNLPTTGLRLFTVYGPWGRPDMAPMLFTDSIIKGKAIKVFNNGNMLRDFTYIDDIVNSIVLLVNKAPNQTMDKPFYQLFNIGNSKPVNLMNFIEILENEIGKKAILNKLPMQPGDVKETYADTNKLQECINYQPNTSLKEGIAHFIKWIRLFYPESFASN